MRKFEQTIGWVGMLLVQCASFPSLYKLIILGESDLPPLSMVLMLQVGLALYFARAYIQRDTVYLVSNGLGFAIQTLLFCLIIF
jgi:uncharacterized protein with PQ loop repeat